MVGGAHRLLGGGAVDADVVAVRQRDHRARGGRRFGRRDVLAGLRRIGIDEMSHRKGQRYLTCVVDQGSGRLVWAAPGRNSDNLHRFLDQLGPDRAAALTHVSPDGAQWIHDTVTARAPQAVLGLDPFHVVGWATRELDKVRRQTWNRLRGNSSSAEASSAKGTRWALLKYPADLSPEQRGSVTSIAHTNRHLYRAYLRKEQLRAVFQVKGQAGRELLAGWIPLGPPHPTPRIHRLAKTLKWFQRLIWNTLVHHMSNAQSPGHQHPPPGLDPPVVRLAQPRSVDSNGDAHPRRVMPAAARPITTHETSGDPEVGCDDPSAVDAGFPRSQDHVSRGAPLAVIGQNDILVMPAVDGRGDVR